jgi:hypothetical protein
MKRRCALIVALALTGAVHAQTGAGAALETCLAQAADYTAVYPTTVFPVGATTEVTAVIRLGRGESHSSMTASWIAVEVAGTRPGFVINRTAIDFQGRDRAAMHLKHPDGLLAGTYRLDVTAEGRLWRSAEFRVAPIAAPVVTQPQDMVPLASGTVWPYAFTQEFGPGIRPQLPAGMALDADGKLRLSMTMTATGSDATGTHIESRRGSTLIEEDWWRLTDAGLVMVKLSSGGNESVFDPPHPIWPWPLKAPHEWSYQPEDKSFTQRWRMWGPVPIDAPGGAAPGYVVLMEQLSPRLDVSAERRYVPGIGLVREVMTQARNGVLLTRWENVLTARP